MANFQGTTEPLKEGETWTSQTRLRERHDTLQGSVFADQDGKLFVDQSGDGKNWDVSETVEVESEKGKSFNVALILPYWRLRYENPVEEAEEEEGENDQEELRVFATTQAGGDS